MERLEPYFYQPFPTFVFRTPHISFQQFAKTLSHLDEDESYWQKFLQNPSLQEAIFLATPVLYDEIQKFLAGTLTVPKEVNKLKMSVMRYYTRMSTRCTPFGLFAGFSLGKWGEKKRQKAESSPTSQSFNHSQLITKIILNSQFSIFNSQLICTFAPIYQKVSLNRFFK